MRWEKLAAGVQAPDTTAAAQIRYLPMVTPLSNVPEAVRARTAVCELPFASH
jgi:hypothetical protein